MDHLGVLALEFVVCVLVLEVDAFEFFLAANGLQVVLLLAVVIEVVSLLHWVGLHAILLFRMFVALLLLFLLHVLEFELLLFLEAFALFLLGQSEGHRARTAESRILVPKRAARRRVKEEKICRHGYPVQDQQAEHSNDQEPFRSATAKPRWWFLSPLPFA